MSETPWTNHVYAAVRHPNRPAILVLQDGASTRLPYYRGENLWLSLMGRFNSGLSDSLGAPLWGLRQFHYRRNPEARETEMLIEAELCTPTAPLPGYTRWISRKALEDPGFAHPDLLPHLLRFLDDLETGRVPAARTPWARPGWRAEAEAWIGSVLAGRGIQPQTISAFKLWGVSAVLRIETGAGEFWFKTTNRQMPLFVNEAAMTGTLAGMFPGAVPRPIATRAETDWMLLEAFDETFERPISTETLCEVFGAFAHLQVESIPRVDELFAAGAIDRRLPWLRTRVPEMLADPVATERLSDADRAEILGMEAVFLDLIDRLAACAIPATLVHGDLHTGNAAIHQGRTIYFDWTDASIAQPFFDMMAINWLEEQAEPVRQAYLQPWQDVLPGQDLEAIADLAMAVLQLHHATSYLEIVRHLEPDSKIELNFTHEYLLEARDRAKAYLEKHPPQED